MPVSFCILHGTSDLRHLPSTNFGRWLNIYLILIGMVVDLNCLYHKIDGTPMTGPEAGKEVYIDIVWSTWSSSSYLSALS